jgi:hypothetical protein
LTSFGSICFGSFILPSFQVLRVIAGICTFHGKKNELPGNETVNEFVEAKGSRFFENIEAVNGFGITVLGMSHVNFLSAGRKSYLVFRSMDWIDVVNDKLIPNILLISTFFISFSSGCFSLVVEEFDGYNLTNFRKPMSTAFL